METSEGDARIIGRLLYFSDAVFAIVLTLLVLELHPPHIESMEAFWPVLQGLAPSFVGFVASFALVMIFWAAHMAITRRLAVFDWPTVWFNGLFLMTIAVTPFASAMLGQTHAFPLAWRLYCAVMIAASATQSLLILCIMRDRGRLLAGGVTWRERVWRLLRSLSPGIAFGTGLYLNVTGAYSWSYLCWALIPVILVLSQLAVGPRGESAPQR